MIRNESDLTRTPKHTHALDAIAAGIEAAHPETVVEEAVSLDGEILTIADEQYLLDDYERILVLGGGKPAGAVAKALETVLGSSLDDGLVVTDTPAETETVIAHEGKHPLPTAANVEGAERLLARAAAVGPDDLVLVVITGGGSALMTAPVDGVSLDDYRDLTEQLLYSGATVDELNAVRKHLSRLKGGRLARELAPATTVGVVFSDVVGNPLDVIASGPTAPDNSTYADALAVLERYEIDAPDGVIAVLEAGARGEKRETPSPDDELFETVTNYVLADNRTALEGATRVCEERGYTTTILSSRIEGEARDVGGMLAAVAQECLDTGDPFDPPVALLSGGETTVTVTGEGTGGPNQECVLAAALELVGEDVVFGCVDTDGIDGPTDAAGALVDGETVADSDEATAQAALDDNDAYGYLDSVGCLARTGPTGTNVNDLRLLLIGAP